MTWDRGPIRDADTIEWIKAIIEAAMDKAMTERPKPDMRTARGEEAEVLPWQAFLSVGQANAKDGRRSRSLGLSP